MAPVDIIQLYLHEIPMDTVMQREQIIEYAHITMV